MKKIKLDLSQINWIGMIVAGLANFTQSFLTTVTTAQAQGIPQVEALKVGAVSGLSAAGAAVWGVLTQRTVAQNGTAAVLPGLTTTHTNLDSGQQQSMLPPDVLDALSDGTLVQIATVLNNRLEARKAAAQAQEDAEAARQARAAQLRDELAKLEGGTSN